MGGMLIAVVAAYDGVKVMDDIVDSFRQLRSVMFERGCGGCGMKVGRINKKVTKII